MADDHLTIRRADEGDLADILALARRSLGWTDDDASFLRWKHLENPFGESSIGIALDGRRVVGFRAFLRWEFVAPDGRVVRAVRAVDTATDPDHQGRGIFTRLTLEAIEELPELGVELIFNTPNEKSRPGYRKMGWREVGRLAVAVMPTSWRFPLVVATARQAAGRWPLPTTVGASPSEVFGAGDLDALLAAQPAPRLATPGHPRLPGVALRPAGTRISRCSPTRRASRRRIRGVPPPSARARGQRRAVRDARSRRGPRRLVRHTAKLADADYLIRLDHRVCTRDPFVQLPRVGPVFTCRALSDAAVPGLGAWALTMGDVELF